MSLFIDNNEDTIRLNKGDVLFREGDLVKNIYVLREGCISCCKNNDGRVFPIFTAKKQGLIGEDCAFGDNKKYFYSAVALEDSYLIKMSVRDIKKYLSSSNEWIRKVLTDMSDKLEHTAEFISEHRIVSEKLNAGVSFSSEEEAFIKKALK